MIEEEKNHVWMSMLIPKDFAKEIKDFKHTPIFDFFNRDFLFVFAVVTKEEKVVKEFQTTFCQIVMSRSGKGMTQIIDDNKIIKEIKEVSKFYNNGLSLKNYYPWFMELAVIIKSMHGDGNSPCFFSDSVKYYNKETDELMISYIYFTNNENLLKEPTYSSIVDLTKERIHKHLSSKPKNNKKGNNKYLTKSIRYEVLKRDNFKCVHCGKTKKDTSLEIDHIIPSSRNGTDTLDNLQTLCKECNLSKSNRILK